MFTYNFNMSEQVRTCRQSAVAMAYRLAFCWPNSVAVTKRRLNGSSHSRAENLCLDICQAENAPHKYALVNPEPQPNICFHEVFGMGIWKKADVDESRYCLQPSKSQTFQTRKITVRLRQQAKTSMVRSDCGFDSSGAISCWPWCSVRVDFQTTHDWDPNSQ